MTDPHPSSSVERKRAMRAQVRARRAVVDPRQRAADGSRWADVVLALVDRVGARTVAAYVSYGTEPPTDQLIDALRARGVEVLLPVLLDDRDLDWEADGQRRGPDAIGAVDVVVVPALSVGRDGVRLGQGGGSYDRALARVSSGTPIVALVHTDELLPAGEIPDEPHDVHVTHAATPTGLSRCNRRDTPLPVDPDAEVTAGDHPGTTGPDVALAVAAGGALGSLARWTLGEAWPHQPGAFPWSTLTENVMGCFLIGVVVVLLIDVWLPSRPLLARCARPFLITGVLGGFTTFSAYAVDVQVLLDEGRPGSAALYGVATVLACVLAAAAGLRAGRVAARVHVPPLLGRRA